MSDETKALAVPEQHALAASGPTNVVTLANAMYKSGYFPDVKSAAQALVKILYGQEIGLGPAASMANIYISKNGTPTASAQVLAAAIRKSKRYDFRIVKLDDTVCTLAFFLYTEGKWQKVGESTFTVEDARKADLLGKDVWKKYPRNLLFARALSNGKRWYCSDVAMGFYTPEELEQGPDEGLPPMDAAPAEESPVFEGEVIEPSPEPEKRPATNGNGKARSWPGKVVQWALANMGEYYESAQHVCNTLNQSDFDPKRDTVDDMQTYLAEHAAKRMVEKEEARVEEADAQEGGNE